MRSRTNVTKEQFHILLSYAYTTSYRIYIEISITIIIIICVWCIRYCTEFSEVASAIWREA